MPKEYGKPDADPSAYNLLLQTITAEKVVRILHHPRIPIDARLCQLPGSLLVQAVLEDGRVISVRQAKAGATPKVLK